MALGQRMAPSDVDVRRLWGGSGDLRLFLSHVSRHKVAVSAIRDALLDCGISAFVAHEVIEPSLEWQHEISLALRSMHALSALITPDFHDSKWTDQEVGWALGRGVPVLPVRLGCDPYGFVGKIQAIPGSLEAPHALADALVRVLLRSSQVRSTTRSSLVDAFARSGSYAVAKRLKNMVIEVTDFTEDEKHRLRNACSTNNQVANAHGVPQAIYAAIGAPATIDMATDKFPF